MTDTQNLNSLIERSSSTDIPILLKAKEDAKRKVKEDPSSANLAAYNKAAQMLDNALKKGEQPRRENFKSVKEIELYLRELGRKTSNRHIYNAIKEGQLHRQKDGTFTADAVDRYAATRPLVSMPEKAAEEIGDLAEQKLREETLRVRVIRQREEFDLAVKQGKYLAKDDVYMELAARAVVLSSGLKTMFEARCLELVELLGGDSKKTSLATSFLHGIIEDALNEYSKNMEFEVEWDDEGNGKVIQIPVS